MRFFQLLATLLFISLLQISLNAQSTIKTFDFKKGEVLDILLLSNQPDNEALFEKYKKTAFPVAMKLSYQPLPGYAIAGSTQGNIQPEVFAFGKWSSLEKREAFLVAIEKEVPDFHEQRRALWSIFNLTYYEMPADISFQIDKDKVTVATAYWGKDAVNFAKFKKALAKKTKKSGGKTVVELMNGKSPFGYYYQPDYLVITEWKDKATFDAFYQANIKMKHDGVKHVNQFMLK